MSETFDTATTNPGFGGVNLCGATFNQGGRTEFLPACYLVFGPHGGPYTGVDVSSGLPVSVVNAVSISGAVSVSNFPGVQPVSQSGPWAVTISGTPSVSVSGTLPVSLASLPLPAGASQDGTDATGVTAPLGASGIRGWLSSLYRLLLGVLQVPGPRGGPVPVAHQGPCQVSPTPGSPLATAALARYNLTSPPASTGQLLELQCDSQGRLILSPSSSQTVSGTVTANQGGAPWSMTVSGSVAVTGTFWQTTQPISGTVSLTGLDTGPGLADADCLRMNQANCGSASETSVAGSASSVTILAANSARVMASVQNDSSATLYLRMSSSAASTSTYTVQIPPGGYFEFPFPVYEGPVTGIWSSATGNARVTEYD